ncbi:nucleotidyltransferase domain-containing protein [Candidatus Micrarchaeota archaeon]|nr:nucleotidyltransferase domain-containing protein [Candidatus Micrarchaeota archaeon]
MLNKARNAKERMDSSSWAGSLKELSSKPFVLAVYLFGSRAKGTARPYSDADLCVVSETPLSRAEKEDVLGCASKNVDVRVFWDLPLLLRFKMLKEGVLLHSKNELKLHRVTVRALRDYLDFSSVIKRFLG